MKTAIDELREHMTPYVGCGASEEEAVRDIIERSELLAKWQAELDHIGIEFDDLIAQHDEKEIDWRKVAIEFWRMGLLPADALNTDVDAALHAKSCIMELVG